VPIYEIASLFNVSKTTITNRLNYWGETSSISGKNDWIDQYRDAVIAYYVLHKSARKTAKKFSISPTSLLYKLNKWGIDTKKVRRLPLNDFVFDVLSEEPLYWIGFLMADGNVSARLGETPSVSVASGDLEHVRKFAKFMESGHKIYKNTSSGKKNPVYQLAFRSDRLAGRLAKFGVVPRKSHVAHVPDDNPNVIFSRHYNRGLIDGDGSLWWQKSKTNKYPILTFTSGSRRLISQFDMFLKHNSLPLGYVQTRWHDGYDNPVYNYRVNYRKAVSVTNFLYINSNIYLDRKYEIALQFSKIYKKEVVP
jgi:hypothetical protein